LQQLLLVFSSFILIYGFLKARNDLNPSPGDLLPGVVVKVMAHEVFLVSEALMASP
jgi:hypothetical protein